MNASIVAPSVIFGGVVLVYVFVAMLTVLPFVEFDVQM